MLFPQPSLLVICIPFHLFYRAYREKVELVRKKKLELQAARSSKLTKASKVVGKESNHEESSSDDDGDVNFAVDWRAQHL